MTDVCWAWCARCPDEGTAFFLYRKLEAVQPQPVLLPAPVKDATAEEAGQWIAEFAAKLQECAGAEEGSADGEGSAEGEAEGEAEAKAEAEAIEAIDRPAKVRM